MNKCALAFAGFILVILTGCGGGGSSPSSTQSATPPTVPANSAPVANAGTVQNVAIGSLVTLNGSASSDANGDPLTYSWTITSKPIGSIVMLTNSTTASPSLSADRGGAYVLALMVNDGKANSAASTVTINAATEVAGIISTNSLWLAQSSPYRLTGAIQIASGSTLTVEPGVHIMGGNNSIGVFGVLSAIGTTTQKIIFDQVKVDQAGTGTNPSLIQIENAMLDGGGLLAAGGNSGYGSLILRDSVVTNQQYIYLWYPVAVCYIERNVFKNTGGISVGSNSITVNITNNVFVGIVSDVISVFGGAITNWASYGGQTTIVSKNSFLDSGKIALSLPSGYTSAAMTATNNYWGTTLQNSIQSMIYDKTNDLSSADYIAFAPFLTQPDPATPTYP